MSLPEDYVLAIGEAERIWLVIMGKDRYENDAAGIPFLKEDWSKLRNNNCSGRHVLSSLGFMLTGEEFELLKNRYPEPRVLFLELASSGIVFLNLAYELLGGEVNWENRRHRRLIEEADVVNAEHCRGAWYTMLCGQAKARQNLPSHALVQSINMAHPAFACSIHDDPMVKNSWHAWWSQDAIFNWVRPVEDLHANLRRLTGRE